MAKRQAQHSPCMVHHVAEPVPFCEYGTMPRKVVLPVKPVVPPKFFPTGNDASKVNEAAKETRMARSASMPESIKRHVSKQLCQQMSGAMPLSQFVAHYVEHLPLRVKVQSGYYGNNSHLTISAGEVLNVYFKKDTTVVSVKVHNNTFSVPLNSSLQFSLLHPVSVDEATKGFVYYSVADLMAANPCPKVVCCIEDKSWKGLVQDKEILVIAANQSSTNNLKVFSTLTRTDKSLPADLQSVFSTHPDLVALPLSELLSLVPDVFPCSTIISNNPHLPTTLQQVNTLLGTTVESTLLCASDGSSQLFDIPLDIPGVEVIVLPTCNETEMEQLHSSAEDIIKNFNPSNVQVLNDSGSRLDIELQVFLYSNVRAGFENSGINIFGSSVISSLFKSNSISSLQLSKQEYSVLTPLQNTINGKTPSSRPDILPRQTSLPDIDDISPAYNTLGCLTPSSHKHNGYLSKTSSAASLHLEIATAIQEEVCLSLQRFATKYSERLPLSIQIQSGSYHSKLVHITKSDVFTVHFIVNQEVISFRDNINNNVYILPLTAATEFGIACASGNGSSTERAEFEVVGDILDMPKLPKILCARRSFKGNDAKSSVEVNEVLVVKSVKKMKKILKVYSITAKMKKYLSAKCKGHFTTAPDSTKLSIQKVLEHFPDLLPLQMVVFPRNQELPSHLFSQEVTVISHHAKDSLIVSPVDTKSSGGNLFSIPVSVEVEVLVIQSFGLTSSLPANQAQQKSEDWLSENEDYIPFIGVPLNALDVHVQQVTITSQSGRSQRRPHLYESLDSDEYLPPQTSIAGQVNTTPLQTLPQSQLSPSCNGDGEMIDYAYVDCQYRASISKFASPHLSNQVSSVDGLNKQNLSSFVHVSPDIYKGAVQDENAEKARKENKAFIALLKEDQILAILQGMGLHAYKDKFHQENITGDIFGNLDDEILEKELGIQSRLHRLRLLKVARGDTDAKQYLQ